MNTDFAEICISHKIQILSVRLGRIYTLNFSAAFTRVISECNLVMENCRDSIKATVKRVKTQIPNGANPEKAARNGYEKTCDYLDILNKRIHIQQRALARQSKALTHILQREMYTMGKSVLIRHEAELTNLQLHLGDTRRQEFRCSPICPSPLFHSQLVKAGEEFILKTVTPKTLMALGPIKPSTFVVPTIMKKRDCDRKCPYGGQSIPSSNQSFFLGRGISSNRGSRGRLRPHPRG